MGWSQWYALGSPGTGIVAQSINSSLNVFGRLELFAKSSDRNMYRIEQTLDDSNTWSSWRSLGSPRLGDDILGADVARYVDNRLELFVVSPKKGDLYYAYQTSPTSDWSSWRSLGSPAVGQTLSSPVAVDYARGRVDIIVINTSDGSIYQKHQTSSQYDWSSWNYVRPPISGGSLGLPALGRMSPDSPLELFVPSLTDRKIYYNQESVSTPGQWIGWTSLDSPGAGGSSVYSSPKLTNRKDIFTVDRYNVYNRYYTSSGDWSSWEPLGGPGTGVHGRVVSVGRNVFGCVDLFVSEGETLYHKYLHAPGDTWSPRWLSLGVPSPGQSLIAITTINYRDGQIGVFVIDSDGNVHHIRQI
jgi:hypothetical protein